MSHVRDVSLSEQLDPSTPAYINARLMELEQRFQEAPQKLAEAREVVTLARDKFDDATEDYQTAKAHAFLDADGRNKESREAQALIATEDERKAVRVAEAAYKYAQDRFALLSDKVKQFSQEKDALQTRAATLRAEMQLAGKGRP